MEIKVLGSGCANCRRLEALTSEVLGELGLQGTLDKVTDFAQIAAFVVMHTPALMVDGAVVLSGRVPAKDELRRLIEGLVR
jgi:small redox-active disulfide protein 2